MVAPASQIDKFKVVENPPEKRQEDDALEHQLTKLIKKYDELTKSSRQRRHYIQAQVDLFAKGIHFTSYDPRKATFTEWNQEDVDACMYTPVPLVEYAVESIAAQYTTSKPNIVPHCPTDDRKMKAVVRELKVVADDLFNRFYLSNPEDRQREAKLCPLRGGNYIFLEYDYDKGPEYEMPQYQGQEQMACLECGAEVPAEMGQMDQTAMMNLMQPGMEQPQPGMEGMQQGPMCPECGSTELQAVMGLQNQGNQTKKQGEVCRYVVDGLQVEVFDRRFDVDKSPYLFYDEILFTAEAKKLYPWVKIDGKACLGRWDTGYSGLHYLYQLETMIANTGRLDQSKPDYTTGYGGAYLNELQCWRRRAWFDHCVYADIVLPNATQLPGTQYLLPQGTRLGDVYPDGLCIHLINDTIAKLDNQNKNDVWSHYKYSVASTGQHGTGVASIVSMNRGYDELTSIQTQAALMSALGITMVDERVKSFKNIPGQYCTVPTDARMPGESLENLVAHKDTKGPSADVEMVRQSYRELMADLSRTSNPNSSGLDREGMGTATGVKYQASAVNTLTAPPLELFAANCAKVIEQAVKLEKKFNLRPRLYSAQGSTTKRWFDPIDIPDDVRFYAEEDSYQPRTMQTQRDDLAAGISLGVGTGTLEPALDERARQLFGLDKGANTYEDWAIKAESRLDAMKLVAEQVEMAIPDDPETAGLMIIMGADAAPRPMDSPEAFTRFWQELYLTDEFEEFTPGLQKAVEMLWTAHQDAGAALMALQVQRGLVAQGPAMQLQQSQMEEQEGKQKQAEAEGRMAEEESAERAHGREMEKQASQQKHEQKMAQTKAKVGQAKGKK